MKLIFTFLLLSCTAYAVDFNKDIKPIFQDRCAKCHGEDKQKSEFRLDVRSVILKGGDLGEPGAVPGHPEKSTIVKLISLNEDHDDIMPPKGDPLSKNQITLIAEWIREGAKMPEKEIAEGVTLWSLKPVTKPQIPVNASNPIDSFLKQKLSEKGLTYSRHAEPVTLLRRTYTILIGILPTPEESDKFMDEWEKNPQKAFESKVDELLSSKHFGERWAQHWLDAIRWAETSGSESNLYRKNAWGYRDYVINSFNNDKPYNQFIVDQIAGDQTGFPRATGFLVSGPHVPPATVGQQPEAILEARYDRMDQVIQTLGASVMGLTLGCARCHSHKFDPVKINDYYSILANFQGLEFGIRVPELPDSAPRVSRAGELMKEIQSVRKNMNKRLWLEDWEDHIQIHLAGQEVNALRLTFPSKNVFIDEFEIFSSDKDLSKLANISTNLTGPKAGLERLTDGEIGTFYAFRGEAPDKEKGVITFSFDNPLKIDYFTISSDRKEINNTDYIISNKYTAQSANFKLEIQSKDGKWIKAVNNIYSLKPDESLQTLIEKIRHEGPQYEFIGRFIDPLKTHVLKRGSPQSPGAEVFPGTLSVLNPSLNTSGNISDTERRMKFANWLASEENPLTARVMVNRLWHHIFGQGIVTTLSDFGNAGAAPSHPELLDYLATEFIKNGWSVKKMIKAFVMTEAFQQDNRPRSEALKIDSSGKMLWRFTPRRAEAEVLRDSILQLSGSLKDTVGGKSFRIHNVKKRYDLWEVVDNYSSSTWRRMIYQERMRGVDDRMFTAFDFPDCGQVLSKRPSSTTPLQALNLMNSQFIEIQCRMLAKKVQAGSPAESVQKLFSALYNRKPANHELSKCLEILTSEKMEILCRALVNSNEFVFIQ